MENLKKFFNQHVEESKNFFIIKKNDVQEFLEEQETLINDITEKIKSINVKADDKNESHPVTTTLENFMNNPGLQHLAEKIFSDLNNETLEACRHVSQTFQQFLDANHKIQTMKFGRSERFGRRNAVQSIY